MELAPHLGFCTSKHILPKVAPGPDFSHVLALEFLQLSK
jgi:hypothetical protein